MASFRNGDQEAAERHCERAHDDDVSEHRAGLHEVERHGRERDRRKEPRAAIDQSADERVRGEDPEQAPEGERRPAGPLVQAEVTKPERDRRERELRTAEIIQVRQGVVCAVEHQVRGDDDHTL